MADADTPAFTTREIQPDEYVALGQITVRAYANLLSPADTEYIHELRDVQGRAAAVPVLVAVDGDGRVLGGVTYVPGPGTALSEGERDGEAGIRMLAVDPSLTGRGIGRALAVACVDRARDEGRSGMTLYTLPTMTVAHRLYESLGFRRDSDRDWEYLPGEWLLSYAVRLEPAP
ncbi:MAG: GNAT family N-acetyltransferase [Chloroflexota bacterium]